MCCQLLPEYQVSHERAVYKTVAIVADTKKIVQNINMESLAELRSMNKPVIEVEDLLAAIIMIREFKHQFYHNDAWGVLELQQWVTYYAVVSRWWSFKIVFSVVYPQIAENFNEIVLKKRMLVNCRFC